MRTLQTLLISLISLTLNSQNKPFMIVMNPDSMVVNRIDTVFTYITENGSYLYDNSTLNIKQSDELITKIFSVKIKGFRKDPKIELPIAELVTQGRYTMVDNKNKKKILEGNFMNGKQVGVWHDRTHEFEIINFFDSSGIKLPLVKYIIDTSDRLIYVRELDTLTFDYALSQKINLMIDPFNYFKTESAKVFSEDTMRFCTINLQMDTLGYQSCQTTGLDFVRFVWFRDKNPINLNLVRRDSGVSYSLLVTDAEFDLDFGNVIQKESFVISDTKDFIAIKNELDKMNFWGQISKDGCRGDYLFIEAKIHDKYNSKRINCLEYRLPENFIIMKLFEKLAQKAGLENEYKIVY